jgi:cell division protein FtsW (lipid II flippase)
MENNNVQEYINKVCMLIKNKDVHYDINLELQDHIQTLKEDFISSGLSEEEATEKALAHMGNPDLIGKELNKTHKARLSWGVIIPLLCFSIFGLVTMYFIQSSGAVSHAEDIQMFQKNLVFYVMGISFMVGLYFFDYRRILPYSKGIYIAVVLLLASQISLSIPINGSYYFHLGVITVNLIPYCLMLLVISLSGIFLTFEWHKPLEFIKALGLIIVPGLLMLRGPISFGFLYFIAVITLMIMSKARMYQVLLSVASPIVAIYTSLLLVPYRLRRFTIFLDPASDPENSGWIYLQVKKAIASAGLFGKGFTLEPRTIPELHTDFIFTYIVHSFGWIIAAIVIAFIVVFLLKLMNIAKITKNSYGKLLVSAFIAILTTEFLLSLGMNFGISPMVGISLPFMSFGGSQLVINMIIVGLILSVYRRKDIRHNMIKISATQ